MELTNQLIDRVQRAVNRRRLVDTAMRLVAVPSPTGDASAVSDCLAAILAEDGFTVERPEAGHAKAPAVVTRLNSLRPGRTLQFNGHLDTVHLPFVPPQVEADRITGSGASDMKAGIAAAVEALRVLRDTDSLPGGSVLLTAHDLHEAPWGDGRQLNQLIAEGYVGDGVLLPEYLNDCLPIIGRGALIWKVTVRRPGHPIHEVMRPANEPDVIAVGAELVARLGRLGERLSLKTDARAGSESIFVGQVHSGEIYNQYPQECRIEGTRRWLPATKRTEAESELRELMASLARDTGAAVDAELQLIRDAFLLDGGDALVGSFQSAYTRMEGRALPPGAKPFCDDANSFWSEARRPAITHGPQAGGAHTLSEWVSIPDLVRVATLYALTALAYCDGTSDSAGAILP